VAYLQEWRTISARIDGVRDAAHLLSQFLMSNSNEVYGASRELGRGCADVLDLIRKFAADYADVLPKPAVDRIGEYVAAGRPAIFDAARQDLNATKSAVVMLLTLRAELDHLLTDQQEQIRSRTERAFLHLQRVLAVDPNTRAQWEAALNGKGETACEQLGAVHLLLHGIFAFKANTAGAHTDLVFADMRDDFGSRGLDGLVLTEWKMGNDSNAATRFAEARAQMKLYQRGALAGPELTSVRYAVVVSDSDLKSAPPDQVEDGVLYRHISIAVAPDTPSKQARARKKPA
jgi:hypothetical protein